MGFNSAFKGLIRVRDVNVNMNIANQNSIDVKWKINKRFESVTEFTVKPGCLKTEGPYL
jgi:hypothetical protein